MNAAVAGDARGSGKSARYEWQIDRDLIRGRKLDFSRKFLPDGLSLIDGLEFLSSEEARLLSQIQGRTYAYMFGMVERFISAKMLEQSRAQIFDDPIALEGLVRFSSEEIKHQELFQRIEAMLAEHMPAGYSQTAAPNDVGRAVLAACTWSVLALTCHIELFVQTHYAESIAPREQLCPLFRDVFQFHWRDECQHVILDELEWSTEHQRLSAAERDLAVNDFIALMAAVDGVVCAQAASDAGYFRRNAGREFSGLHVRQIEAAVIAAYRWQYIISGLEHPHFARLLTSMTTPQQMSRIMAALAPIMQ